MKTIILVVTEPKDSYYEDNMKWHKEYAVLEPESELDVTKFYSVVSAEHLAGIEYPPYFGVRRRVETRNGIDSYGEWEILSYKGSAFQAALDIGDSDFYNGNGTHPLFEEVQAFIKNREFLEKEFNFLKGEIAWLPNKYQEKYNAELKSKRIFSKAEKGTAPKEIVDEIRNRLLAEYEAEKVRITQKLSEIVEQKKRIGEQHE